MLNHPIILLVQKIESHHAKEIQKYFFTSKKQRTEKLYKLITNAKNEEQLERGLIFKKLFGKSYSEKNDYLWRNEIRVLKEELENFLIIMEHQYISKNNEAYNDWLLIQAFDRLKYTEGIDEKYSVLVKNKNDFASYNYVMDAALIHLNNLHHKITDVSKREKIYPEFINETKNILKDVIAAYVARLNIYTSQYNWLCHHHQNSEEIALTTVNYSCELPQNNISQFYNNYALSFTTNFTSDFELQIQCLDKALENIKTIYKNNKLLQENRILVFIAKGRELSSNGHFLKAHETLKSIKDEINKNDSQHRTVFYINYITNLVKSKLYVDALYTLDNEFTTDNLLYKNMLLQSRLLCYLYLRDTKSFEKYISYDLDDAPFPQNYMLKVIKSAYFYLLKDYDTALTVITSLLQAKYAADRMKYYQPMAMIYKKLYTLSQKNVLQKKWILKDIQTLKDALTEFENTSSNEIRLVSIFSWIKQEIENNLS